MHVPVGSSSQQRSGGALLCLAVSILVFASVPANALQLRLESVGELFAMDAHQIVAEYGEPLFGSGAVLVYRSSFAELSTDVTLFFGAGHLQEMALDFDIRGKDTTERRTEADRVVKRLGLVFGMPEYSLRDGGEYRTYLWGNDEGTLIHCVVYTGESARHTIRVQRRGT